MLDGPLVFLDLETTGATAHYDRITEIGIVEVDENGVREWSCLVNPGTTISGFIERLTGISNAMVADAPPFEDVADEVRERHEGRLFIAHNARFDWGFVSAEMRRARAYMLSEFSAKSWEEVRPHYLTGDDLDRHFRMATSFW